MKSLIYYLHAFGITTLCKNILFYFILVSSFTLFSQQLAFPTASGAGAYVTGGRDGSVYHVTNLNNSGTGSFRAAVSGSNRTIVFDVSGTIELTSDLSITADNLTIAGQSAPEGGITITGRVVYFQNTNNTIVRYIRFRPNYNASGSVDALNAINATNFIADHCSISWGGDEAFSLRGSSSNATVQNCILGESATGMLAGESSNASSTNFSINNNLWYNISHRFPNVNGIRTDVINNVVHNWFTRLKVVASRDNAQLNEINNFYQAGTKTGAPRSPDWSVNWLDIGSSSQRSNIRIYSDGNVYPSFLTEGDEDWDLYVHRFSTTSGAYAGISQWDEGNTDFKVASSYELLGEAQTVMTAAEALIHVPLNSGANAYLNSDGSVGEYRDNIDDTYVTNVINGTSENYSYPPTNIVNKQSYVNFHNSVSNTPINSRPNGYDSDNDGMADEWEVNTFNDLSHNGTADTDNDGYTDLEEFLNSVDVQGDTNGSQVTVSSNATNDTICEGEDVILTASNADSYAWDVNDETTPSITVSPNVTTTYTITGTHSDGSTTQAEITITVNEIPTANAGQDIETCQGTAVTLTATGGTSYEWNTGQTTQSITVNPSVTTTYSVEVTQNNCKSSDAVVVTVKDTPNVDAGEDVTIFIGQSATLTATGADSYLWSTGETTQSITVNPVLDTSYSVTGTTNGCEGIDTITVFLLDDSVNANAGNDMEICNGETITLTATGGTTYLWNTGETTSSISVSPNTTTTYTVTAFSVSGANQDEDSVIVTVNEVPIANAGANIDICFGNATTLTASGGSTYLWNTGQTSQSITVSPNATTTYTVEVFENNCSDTDEIIVNVSPLPNVDAGTNVTISEGESTTLTATGADTYLWNTGETTATITVSPDATTTYSVTGFLNGCEAEDSVIVTIQSENIIASAGEDVTICNGESTTLTATGGTTYLWNTGETTASIDVSPNTTTTYTVTAFNASGSTSDNDTVIVTVNELPGTDAGANVTISEGESTTLTATGAATYLWNTGATTSSITVTPNSSTTYTVTGFSNNCEFSDTVTVTVETENIIASAGEDVTICNGESTTLTATGGTTYLWNTGETTASIDVSPNTTTTYTVTAFNASGSTSDNDTVIVTVNELPGTDAGANVTISEGESTTLTATGAATYLWNTGATTSSITVTPNSSTTYTVTGFSNNCEATDQVTVTVETENIIASAGEDVTICNGESTTLTATGGITYLWNTGETTASIDVSPNTTTTYTVTAFNASGSTSDNDTVIVTVNELPNTDAGADVTISEGESTTLMATGAETYVWNTGETTQSITVTPNSSTTYTVIGFSNNCEATDQITVTVEIENVSANAGEDVTICNGESTTLTATGGTTYLWSTGETTSNITVNPNTTTTYTVTAFNTAQTASDEDSVEVTVNELPNTDAGADITIIEGESTTLTAIGADTYVWNTGETTTSISVNPITTTTYSVTGFSNGCEFTDIVLVTVEPFVFEASAGANQTICQGYSTTLTASEGDAYLWSTGETTQSITVNPSGTQTYTVTVYEGAYEDDADVTVSVNPNPNVVISNGGEVIILEGEFVTLSASGANSYLWNNGATQPNIAVSPSATTTYEVTGFINNCEDTTAVVVNVVEEVLADAGEDLTICSEETVTLTATGGEEYLWNTGETTQSIDVSPDTDTEYSVLVYNALDSDEDSIMVFVEVCNTIENIPPDTEEFGFIVFQDPVDDVLKVRINGLQSVTAKGISIYDMAGKILYTELFSASEFEDQSEMTRTINASTYARGIYMVRLIYDDTSVIKKIPIR